MSVQHRLARYYSKRGGGKRTCLAEVGTARCAVRAAFSGASTGLQVTCGTTRSARWTRAETPQRGVPIGARNAKHIHRGRGARVRGQRGQSPQSGKHRTRTAPTREFARQLRKQSTDAERRLWRLLRDRRFNEFKFRRQYPCGIYFLDFYCTIAKLAVELDGGGHGFPDQRARDENRNQFLAQQGIKVLRFWNHQVRGELETVRLEIWHALMERTGRTEEIDGYLPEPAPSPQPSPPVGARESEPPTRDGNPILMGKRTKVRGLRDERRRDQNGCSGEREGRKPFQPVAADARRLKRTNRK